MGKEGFMKPVFSVRDFDRGLLRRAVQAFGRMKKLGHEEAHAFLASKAVQFEEVSPDILLKPGQVSERRQLRASAAHRRMRVEKFVDQPSDDEKGESYDWRMS